MDHKVGLLAELLPALGTYVRPLTRVRPAMDSELGHPDEALAAFSTDIGPIAPVDFPVL